MKTLTQYINEHNITSLYKTILSKIENIDPTNVDEETRKIFRRIHSNLQTLDDVDEKSGEKINLISKLDFYLKEKGLEFCKKDITQILINSGDLKKYISIISDNNKLVEFNDILANSNKNLIDIIYNSLKKQIQKSTLQKIAKLKPAQKRITKGDFEIFLKLFTNSASNGEGDYNPIISDNNSAVVEIKNGEGLFAGQKTWTDNTINCKNFNKTYNSEIMPLTSKNKNYLSLINLCKEKTSKYIDKICTKITDIYLNSVTYDGASSLKDDLQTQIKNNIESCLTGEETNKSSQKKFKNQFDELRKILAVFSLICYHQTNKFQFLMITKKTDINSAEFGTYKIFEMPKELKWNNYKSIIDDIQFFENMPYCDNNSSHNININWIEKK